MRIHAENAFLITISTEEKPTASIYFLSKFKIPPNQRVPKEDLDSTLLIVKTNDNYNY